MYRPLLRQAAEIRFNVSRLGCRFASETPGKPSTQERIRHRLDGWITRSPKFFKPTLKALRDAPASYIVSFAILHELTAIIPLAGLFCGFHYSRWLPPYFAEGKWVIEGVEKFGRYFRKKGWIKEKDEQKVERDTQQGKAREVQQRVSSFWNRGEDTGRILVEVATAWAIVKMLLPLRIGLSVWWAPGFARLTSAASTAVIRQLRKRGKRAT